MKNIPVASTAELKQVVKANQGRWYVILHEGYAAKCFGNWAQVIYHPDGLKSSGNYNETQKQLVSELQAVFKCA